MEIEVYEVELESDGESETKSEFKKYCTVIWIINRRVLKGISYRKHKMCFVLSIAAFVVNLNRGLGMNTSLTLGNFIWHKKCDV